jgi:hypothetical protein
VIQASQRGQGIAVRLNHFVDDEMGLIPELVLNYRMNSANRRTISSVGKKRRDGESLR